MRRRIATNSKASCRPAKIDGPDAIFVPNARNQNHCDWLNIMIVPFPSPSTSHLPSLPVSPTQTEAFAPLSSSPFRSNPPQPRMSSYTIMSVLIIIRGTANQGKELLAITTPTRQCMELVARKDLPLMTVRTLAISCMSLYLTLESASWPKPRWNVAGARPTVVHVSCIFILFIAYCPLVQFPPMGWGYWGERYRAGGAGRTYRARGSGLLRGCRWR